MNLQFDVNVLNLLIFILNEDIATSMKLVRSICLLLLVLLNYLALPIKSLDVMECERRVILRLLFRNSLNTIGECFSIFSIL